MRFIQTIKNIWTIEDLRKRLTMTFLLVVVYRLGCYVALPGINPNDLVQLQSQTSGGLMQLLDMFSGGAFSQASIFALGIMPYITASIVIQLLGMVLPSFQKMQREGESGCSARGSQMIDNFISDNGTISTASNHSGGIQGGISNGQDIYFRVAFKPVATLLKEVDTVDANGNPTVLKARGRHDPCVLPRAVPVVEAMAACVILDSLLLNQATHIL